jgi:hypothetical protein
MRKQKSLLPGIVVAVAAFVLLVLLAWHLQAQDARHIDFTKLLIGMDGNPVTFADAKGLPTPMTLGDAAVGALEVILEEDRQATGAAKFKLDELARKIYKKKDAVLLVEEVATIKERIGKYYGPMVIGPAWRILDPAEAKPKEPEKK